MFAAQDNTGNAAIACWINNVVESLANPLFTHRKCGKVISPAKPKPPIAIVYPLLCIIERAVAKWR
jgi:hypothetical protein